MSEHDYRVANSDGGSPTIVAQDFQRPGLVDSEGHFLVREVYGGDFVGSSPGYLNPLSFTPTVLAAQHAVSNAPCTLLDMVGYNSDAGLLYVQLFNLAVPIVLGNVPRIVIPVPGGKSNFSFNVKFTWDLGLQVGISTTETTFTSAGAFLRLACRINIPRLDIL